MACAPGKIWQGAEGGGGGARDFTAPNGTMHDALLQLLVHNLARG